MRALHEIPTEDLASMIAQATTELARRAGGQAAAPVQLPLLDGFEPIDPATVDVEERMPDGFSRRYRTPKEVAYLLKRSEDAIVDRIKAHHIGFKRGGRYFVDMTRVRGPL